MATSERAPPQATNQMKSTSGPAITLGDAADVERQISLGLELSLQTPNLARNLPIGIYHEMAVVTVPGYAPRTYRQRTLLLLVLALFGLMTFAAVGQMTGQCRTEKDCLAADNGNCLLTDNGERLLTGTETTQCELRGWGLRIELSERAANMVRALGARFF